MFIFIVILLTIFILGYIYLNSEKVILSQRLLKINDIDKNYFIIGNSLLTFCYLTSFNWSYRLIHSIFLFPIILTLLSDSNIKQLNFKYEKFLLLITTSLILTNWVSFMPIEIAPKLKIIFNFIFFSTSSSLGVFIFENFNMRTKINNSSYL